MCKCIYIFLVITQIVLKGLLEKFRPLENDLYDIKEILHIFEPHVKRLEVRELLTPLVLVVSTFNDAHSSHDKCFESFKSNFQIGGQTHEDSEDQLSSASGEGTAGNESGAVKCLDGAASTGEDSRGEGGSSGGGAVQAEVGFPSAAAGDDDGSSEDPTLPRLPPPDEGPTPPPAEINMKIPPNHLDFATILPSLGELKGN